jgi:flagellar motor switch protein FliG
MTQHPPGLRKAALVLLALGPERADAILRRLPREAVKQITRELAMARASSREERAAAMEDFLETAGVSLQPETTPPPPPTADANAFASLQDAETQTLLESIRDEHPQTVALVLAHLPASKAGEVLAGLESSKQVEVVKRIASIEQISAGVIEQVERGLRQRLGHIMGRTIRAGGVSAVAEILNAADRQVEREILDTLENESPALAEQSRRVSAIFERLLHARDEDIRAVLEQLDHETISLSMRTAREGLRRKVLWNLPAEEARQIEQELQSVEPVRISAIEEAQQRVAEVVHRLDAAGEIDLLARATQNEHRQQAKMQKGKA